MSRLFSGFTSCLYFRIHPWPSCQNQFPCPCVSVSLPFKSNFLISLLSARHKIGERARGAGPRWTFRPRVCNPPFIQLQFVTFLTASKTSGACTTRARCGPRTSCSRCAAHDTMPLRRMHHRTRSCRASATTSKTLVFNFTAALCSGQVAASRCVYFCWGH